jgi:membrane-associated phospholipid phosphatase
VRLSDPWPDLRTRRALFYVVILCATVLLGLGAYVYDSRATFAVAPDTRHYFLGVIPIDSLPLSQLRQHHGAQLLVILGVPYVFAVAVAIMAIIALTRRDKRLACIAVIAPISAEILTELIAKPAFHRVDGDYFTYPSGHVTATASIMSVFALLLRRTTTRTTTLIAAPVIALYVVGSIIGVIVLHMHDLIDAIGGLAMGVGVIALFTALVLEWAGLRADSQL